MNGINIIESRYLTEPGAPVQVKRSWRTRLFSRPWQPWRATDTFTPQIPAKAGYMLDAHTMVMHPDTLRALCQQLPKIDHERFWP